jgi:hypothetical protein
VEGVLERVLVEVERGPTAYYEEGSIKTHQESSREDLHGDEKQHDPWKHAEIHLKNLLKEVMETS